MTRHHTMQKKNNHLVGGIVVLAAGILLLSRNLHIITPELSHYIFSWKTLLIGIGLINLLFADNKIGGVILIAIGSFFWMPEIFDLSVRVSQVFWPSIIILVGLMLLFKKPGRHHPHPPKPWRKKRAWTKDTGNTKNQDHRAENLSGSEDEFIDDVVIFSGSSKIITSQNFKGGKMTAIFGGSELNLSRARLASGRNILNVFFLFGGSEIIVPSDWNIVIEATPIFGGFSDERYISQNFQSEDNNERTLIIRGFVIFGGAEIKAY